MPAAVPGTARAASAGRRVWLGGVAAVFVSVAPAVACAEKPVFRHPFDGAPIQVPEVADPTPALVQFKQTGANAYRDEPAALARGRALYEQWCQVCHNVDGSGKMCPALVGTEHVYPQTSTDTGMFAILQAGASGAMQSFADRIEQDDMLKLIAYVRSLDRK